MTNRILHITTPEAWEGRKASGSYRHASLASEGFIHCSDENQVEPTWGRIFGAAPGLVVLEIDVERLTSELRYEPSWKSRGGELFFRNGPQMLGMGIETGGALLCPGRVEKKVSIELIFCLTSFLTQLEKRPRARSVGVSASASEASVVLSRSRRLRKCFEACIVIKRKR